MEAHELLNLLALRHSDDVFVAECKNGPTQSAGRGEMVRMDAWAMKKSWTNPNTYGYEIKVSRSDFLRDDKWHRYLPYCSQFFFVCAPGVCDPKEAPDGCGLLVASKNAARLYMKRRAPLREVEIPEDLWRYLLMHRSYTCDEWRNREKNIEYWRAWLAEKRESRTIGRNVSHGLAELYEQNVVRVNRENHRLERRITQLEHVQRLLAELGVDPSYCTASVLREKLADATSRIPPRLVADLRSISHSFYRLCAQVDKLNQENGEH